MAITYPLNVYFDASCRLCNSEMQNIKLHDVNNQLILIDCSSAQFDDSPLQQQGINKQDLMTRLHVQDAQGQWLIGVDAFTVMYDTIGLSAMAKLWGGSLTRPWTMRLYPWIAKHRYILSFIGLPIFFDCWKNIAARKALKRSQNCQDGQCSR